MEHGVRLDHRRSIMSMREETVVCDECDSHWVNGDPEIHRSGCSQIHDGPLHSTKSTSGHTFMEPSCQIKTEIPLRSEQYGERILTKIRDTDIWTALCITVPDSYSDYEEHESRVDTVLDTRRPNSIGEDADLGKTVSSGSGRKMSERSDTTIICGWLRFGPATPAWSRSPAAHQSERGRTSPPPGPRTA